ncbi:phosphatase PAP2 family protein [Sphingomonas lutea]|uniref:phosphatase PAP2 family protein n=1 Tax=Sphingomonas lutea TaxID=1045317 RepID=UPI001F38FFA9|nr:phosphatase PAP2 family protein [Sphingomonas lutea]
MGNIRYWLLGLQALFVLCLAAVSDRPIPFEFSRPMAAAMFIWCFGLAFLGFRLCWVLARAGKPVSHLPGAFRQEFPLIGRSFQWAIILGLAMALHGWGKSMIPHVTGGFWADPYLANIDHAIFGTDPWRLVRSEFMSPIYAKAYVSWFAITFATMGVLAFGTNPDNQRILTLYLATLILGGTIGQYVLPSAGPIFYELVGFGPRFHELVATNDPTYSGFAKYLWRHFSTGSADIGTGISAMPSMHVSMSVWTVIAARAIWKPLMIPAILYALTVWLGSIASGWHYATDGIVGAAIVLSLHHVLVKRPAKRREAALQAQPEVVASPA